MSDFTLIHYRGKFAIQFRDHAGRHRISTGTTDGDQARKFMREWIARYELENRPGRPTVAVIWEGYRATLEGRPAHATSGFEWKSLGPYFGHLWADDIKEADCVAYAAMRREKGRSDGTTWTELGRLRSALNWAVKKGLLTKAPHIARPSPPRPRERRMTADQVRALVEACQAPHVRLFAILAYTTGARTGAILDLTWSRVDFERSLIHLEDPERPKSKKHRAIVPINGTLRAALASARMGALTDRVIEWDGRPVANIKTGLRAAARRAGMPWVTAHVFRHTAACIMVENGVSMEKVSKMLGHRSVEVTESVYAHFRPDYLRDAAEALEIDFLKAGSVAPMQRTGRVQNVVKTRSNFGKRSEKP